MPLNTYRDESLLLAQFQNSTVIALTWQGASFKEVPLPSQIMDDFDLSRVVVVPEIGFMHGNTLVRVDVILRELAHPTHREMDHILKTRVLLEVHSCYSSLSRIIFHYCSLLQADTAYRESLFVNYLIYV